MKWIGFVLILVGCGGIGFSDACNYQKNIQTLSSIKQMMQYIEELVGQQHLPLTEALLRCAQRMDGPYQTFLLRVTEQMDQFCGEDIALIWQKQAQSLKKLLGKNYYGAFCHCMDQTGFASATAQAEAIRQYERQLSDILKNLIAQREEKCKLYQSLGIIGGIFICVLLF